MEWPGKETRAKAKEQKKETKAKKKREKKEKKQLLAVQLHGRPRTEFCPWPSV